MNLAPREPLSQVVFVHDYFQLVFQRETLSIYNKATFRSEATVIVQGEPGFADALVSLIDQTAKPTSAHSGIMLSLEFASGAELCIHSGASSHSRPEAFSFASQSGELVVGLNQ